MNSSPPCGRSPSRCLVAALAVTLAVAALPAQEEPGPEARKKRPKIGLVLSGGGARGCAHAGVIKVLEELRIPVDYISANSMGSIVGATYAYGASPAEMIRTLVEMDWAYILQDKPRRADLSFRRKEDDRNFLLDVDIGFRDWKVVLPKGLIQGQNLDIVLRGLVPESYKLHDFSKLPIPFHAVAADIANGEEVVLSKGDLAIAMRASMSVPGAFRPVTIDGRELVDGMIVNNLPIDVVRKMGAEVVIAIDIGTPLMKPEEIGSLLGVTGQMIGILMQRNVDRQIATLTDKDIYLQPNLGDISSSGFGRASESIAIGEKAARGIADKLKKFSVSEEEWQKFLKRQRRPGWPKWQPPVIQGIRITNDSRLSNGVIRANLTVKPGQVLDMKRLKSDLERIYGIADFELVRYRLEEREDGTYLRIRAEEKSWGPGYIKFGLSLVDNLDGDNDYDIGVQYTWRPVNALGAELRTSFSVGQVLGMSAEFYQPLDEGQRWFVSPVVRYRERPTNVFQGRTQIAEVEVDDWLFGFEWGRQLSNWGEIRGGISRQVGRVDPNIGTIPGGRFSFDDAGMSVSFLYDTLDDPNFPGSGATANLSYFWSMPGIGADERYEFFQAGFGYAHTWDRTTAIVFGNYSKATSGTRPVWRLSRIGGFLNLSGFQQGELTGQHSMVGALSIYQQISGVRHVSFGMPVYIGGSIETGNVWDDSDDIGDDLILAGSIWAGIDTPLGPLYLGYGLAEGNDHDSVYLFLGNTFSRNPNRR